MRRALATSILALVPFFACAPAPHGGGAGSYAPLATTNVDALPPGPLPPPPEPRADGRLPPLATPLRYALSLAVDPNKERFTGVTTILVAIPVATPYIVMHGRDLRVSRAVARIGARQIPANVLVRPAHGSAKPDELVLAFPERLPPGRATLEIRYDAPFGDDLAGLYRAKDGGETYAFTQFESVDARRAFPCFDEPSFKTAFDVSIAVPKGMIAVANTPESSRTDGGPWTTFQFQTTRPLPTYLVAFAVGDLEIAEGPRAPVPIRVVTTKGKTKLGGLAMEAAEALVTRLGDYFGIRYPYEKLDLVAVPDFGAGAMENAGLITFREELLLLDPAHAPTSARRSMAQVMAHELAHQWFGDLVTLRWWNDTWLNEGFATWATQKVIDEWQPSFGAGLAARASIDHVMDEDALTSARRVREPVTSTAGAMEAFDGITYQKGAALLRMIEAWIGEETFQKGVRDYLHANAWQTATADDLLRALDVASNRDVSKVAGTFLDQTGVPLIDAGFACPSVGPATASFDESAWRPLGASVAVTPKTWTIPLCASIEGRKAPLCATVAGATPAYASLAKCPAWIYPNAHEDGYFRFTLADKEFTALARNQAKLETSEQIGLLSNLWAAVRSGHATPATLLDALPLFDDATGRYVTERVASILDGVSSALVDDGARRRFRAWVGARFATRKAVLGWEAKPGEADERALARRATLFALGTLAEDDATLREAEAYAKKWLADPASVAPDVASIAVELASRRAGPDRFPALAEVAAHARTPQQRVLALRAMGALGRPEELRRALDFALGDEVKLSEFARIVFTAVDLPGSRPIVVDWMKTHWDALRAKLPARALGRMSAVLDGACDARERDDLVRFLGERIAGLEGARRGLAQAAEKSGLCVALRAEDGAAVSRYFAR